MLFTIKEGLSWDVVKKKVYAVVQPIDWLSKKMRAEIEYKDGYFNADELMSKVEQFLEKLEGIPQQNLLMVDANTIREIQFKLELFMMSVNDFSDEEERRFLYYLLIKKEREAGIAHVRTEYSSSSINRLKQALFLRLLENMEYYQIMNQD